MILKCIWQSLLVEAGIIHLTFLKKLATYPYCLPVSCQVHVLTRASWSLGSHGSFATCYPCHVLMPPLPALKNRSKRPSADVGNKNDNA